MFLVNEGFKIPFTVMLFTVTLVSISIVSDVLINTLSVVLGKDPTFQTVGSDHLPDLIVSIVTCAYIEVCSIKNKPYSIINFLEFMIFRIKFWLIEYFQNFLQVS